MTGLPTREIALFASVLLVYLAAGVVGVLQLLASGEKYKRFLSPLVCLAVVLEAVMLIFRAVTLGAIPLTGLFESMIVLTIVFGLIYLFLSIAVQQVWFGSIMAWVILAMVFMAGTVASPPSEPQALASTPWAIAHGIAMVLGGASIAFATSSAVLYLLGRRRLKRKEVMKVLGRVPNIEKLEHMHLLAVKVAFIFITTGLVSGLGLASVLGTGLAAWLADPKVVCSVSAWGLLGAILILNRMLLLTGKTRAGMTVAAFFLVLFAILGVTVLGVTKHDFSSSVVSVAPVTGRTQK
ncbi:MAG: cytochrome c biogenesis protein CcsA [Planctomycetota bacterium]|jgi:ABC-type uncharacterized transport system permease subunit